MLSEFHHLTSSFNMGKKMKISLYVYLILEEKTLIHYPILVKSDTSSPLDPELIHLKGQIFRILHLTSNIIS